MQMVDVYPLQTIIVCECGLYDLETFLSHQDYNKEKNDIIKVNFYVIISSTFFFINKYLYTLLGYCFRPFRTSKA
jgi:hypothetical protein